MSKYLSILFLLLLSLTGFGQSGWTWTELPNMPEAVSNNAVTQAYSGDSLCVYSFTGIDETKEYSGIHLKSWRYNTVSEQWIQLPDVPDFQGKIAAGASTVNNLIYIIGGYHVNENSTEISSTKNHVFNPETNQWMEDAAEIPVAIDDHIQAVWNDSLIFIVTGWSNTINVNNVQIFDPTNNTWTVGTEVPQLGSYKVFGGAGTIIGDSLFYYGGVNNSFNTMRKLRRGIINPNNPSEIEWEILENSPGERGYRCGAISYQNRVYFVGGAGDGYNFDGISYYTNQGVAPLTRILTWWATPGFWVEGLDAPYGVMDIRGLGKATENSWILCGGMLTDQEVSNKTYLLTVDTEFGVTIGENIEIVEIEISLFNRDILIFSDSILPDWNCIVFDLSGKEILSNKLKKGRNVIDAKNLAKGSYLVSVFDEKTKLMKTVKISHF